MKTQKLKQGIRYDTPEKKYTKSVMYEFDFNVDILLDEIQKDGTKDQTILHYMLGIGEKAYFSEEYLAVGESKDGKKKPDITAIIENSEDKKVKWYIYDMKDTVINAKTALKLCAQWHSGIERITIQYLQGLAEYHIENSLGVITRYWDKEKLGREIEEYRQKIEGLQNTPPLLTAKKSLLKVNEYKEKIRAMQYIIDGAFVDREEITGNKKTYKINYVDLVNTEELIYTAHMKIHL